jgi:phosphoribosylanthranilate isomerase
MIIKASAITNLTDARYFAAQEVQYLGFNLEAGTPSHLDPIYMRAIREWVEGPRITGEFTNTPPADIREAAHFFGLDAVQTDANEGIIGRLSELEGLEVLLRMDAGLGLEKIISLLEYARPYIAFVVLYNLPPVSQLTASWQQLCQNFPVLLHLDGDTSSVSSLLNTLHPAGISVTGGDEERVGVKSFDDLEEIFMLVQE